MFSPIVALMQKIEQIKLNKQKQELKKTVKKEEEKLESEDKKSLIESKGEAKNSEEAKKGKLKELKLKAKVMLLRLLKYILQIIESFILFLISVFGTLGFFIILVVLVLMIAIYGLLHIDFNIPSGEVISSKSDCIQGGTYLEESNWSQLNIGNLSGSLTEYQKNLYKTFTLVDEFLKGDGTNKPLMQDLPHDVAFRVFRGIPAVESSFYIFGYNDTSHDVLRDMTDSSEDDGYIGPHQISKSAYLDYNEYLKFWSGSSTISSWKSKYPKPNNAVKDHFWMPYSVAMSLMHTLNMGSYAKLSPSVSGYEEFKSYTESVMDHFGIQANREECFQYIRALMSVASYLQGQSIATLNYNYNVASNGGTGGGKARIEYLCAVFAASSDDDSKRSFNNYAVILNDESKYKYAEGGGSLREWLIGSQGYGSYISDIGSLEIGTGKNPRVSVEGTPINVPLMKYIYDKYKDDTFMENTWVHIKNSKGQYLSSYHYGLACLFQGNHIVQEMGLSMPISSGGNPEDCDCYEGNSGGSLNLGDRNYDNVVVGEIQGIYPDNIKEEMKKSTLKTHFGKLVSVQSPNEKLNSSLTREQWRQQSKWKVPYQYQSSNREPWASGLSFNGGLTMIDNCPLMQQSYIYSAMTGKAVNVAEITAALRAYGTSSVGFDTFAKIAKDSGFFVRNLKRVNGVILDVGQGCTKEEAPILFPDNSLSLKEQIDYVLDNNGIVGVTVSNSSKFAASKHYFVITEHIGVNEYKTHSASNPNLDEKTHSFEDIVGVNGSYLYTSFATNLMFAYNPNLNSVSGSESSSFTNYLFLGDSFTAGLEQNIKLTEKGHQVKAETSKTPSYWLNDTQFNTLPDSVNGVVVLLGVNNTSETTQMQDLLIKLVNKYNKTVYVQKVFPVGSSYSNFTEMNEKINIFNNTIKTFCESNNNLKFIDTTTGLVTSDGLLENADSMGVHLSSKEQYEKWWTNIETQLNKGSTQNVNTDCVSNSGGKASSVGALDLDLDVIDKVDYAAPNRNLFSQNYMSKEDVEFIVVHYWGSSYSGRSLGSSLVNGYHNASYGNGMTQYVVGVEGAYRTTPDLFIAPHCGGDTHTTERNPAWGTLNCRNKNSIGIEVGNSYVNGKYVYERDAIIHTVGLVKALMIEYNVDVDHVYRHYDCTLKVCPSPFVDDEYNSFNNPSAKSLDYDMGQSQNWVAFKKALQSDTIDWGLFNDYIIDNMSE